MPGPPLGPYMPPCGGRNPGPPPLCMPPPPGAGRPWRPARGKPSPSSGAIAAAPGLGFRPVSSPDSVDTTAAPLACHARDVTSPPATRPEDTGAAAPGANAAQSNTRQWPSAAAVASRAPVLAKDRAMTSADASCPVQIMASWLLAIASMSLRRRAAGMRRVSREHTGSSTRNARAPLATTTVE